VRQRLLDRELLRLLHQAQESIVNLKRLQAQITESEKLASIGQLVGGAAHELNNPIAAMMGYSDLLLNTSLDPGQQDLGARIGQHVRRTKSLVASLISFAMPGSASMAPVELNALLRTAVKLSQPQWKALNIEVRTDLQPDLPRVLGDSNQLLQVCVQLLNSAINAVGQKVAGQEDRGILSITAEHKDGVAVIHIFDANIRVPDDSSLPPTIENDADGLNRSSARIVSGLGLSACQGILLQHRGRISWQRDQNAGTSIRVELPVMTVPPRSQSMHGSQIREAQPFA
jgi:two-component system NtrC family sensor kinase